MLTDVKPLAEIVGRSPEASLVDGHQPCVIALAKLSQRLFPHLMQNADLVVAIVSLDRLPPPLHWAQSPLDPLPVPGAGPCRRLASRQPRTRLEIFFC